MEEAIVVMITTSSEEEGVKIADLLLGKRLIACANIISGVRSLYRWKGELCDDKEVLLLCKTRSDLFPRLSTEVKRVHTYDVPEMIALPIREGWPPYLEWLHQETSRDG